LRYLLDTNACIDFRLARASQKPVSAMTMFGRYQPLHVLFVAVGEIWRRFATADETRGFQHLSWQGPPTFHLLGGLLLRVGSHSPRPDALRISIAARLSSATPRSGQRFACHFV
jgi:hypothetical protein